MARRSYRTQKVLSETRGDGTRLLRSAYDLAPVTDSTNDWLHQWAARRPDGIFLAERSGPGWRRITYRETLDQVQALAARLVARGLDQTTPILILSGNSIDHALLTLAAHYVAIPTVPVAEQYSLLPGAEAQLRYITGLIDPGLVYAEDGETFARALTLEDMAGRPLMVSRNPQPGMQLLSDGDACSAAELQAAHAQVTPDTVAKILMTSGSTSNPKGVITTQRMLCANQAQYTGALPFLEDRPPVLVDWLPWNHVFGGSNNFNQVLAHGGSLYIDDGKPAPALIGRTVENLKLQSPTIAYNVPVGFGLLRDAMQSDPELKRALFGDLDMLFYAGAALPPDIWQDLDTIARELRGGDVMLTTCWGMTETAPACIFQHQPQPVPGLVGAPLPGVTVKLVPEQEDRFEVRVKGPNITPGYYRDPDKTADAFDDEGFFLTEDAMTLAEPHNPSAGLRFAGRIAEDFKLATGTWVRATALRLELLGALKPLVQDVILTGEGRDAVGVLILPAPDVLARCGDTATGGLLQDPGYSAGIARRLAPFADPARGSASRLTRALVLSDPPSMATGEITAKGNLNFRKLLLNRSDILDALYSDTHSGVIHLAN
jgi:feruloyl-CoA synthase